MIFRVLFGSILAAGFQMAWGAVFWMYSPYPFEMMQRLPSEETTVAGLRESVPESGHYFYPYPDPGAMQPNTEANKALTQKHREGPLVELIYHKDGLDPMSPEVYAMGFGQLFAASFLMALVLALTSSGVSGPLARVILTTLMALFAVVAITLANPVWYHHPWKYSLYQAGFQAVGWFLAGVVLAVVVRRRRA